MTSRFPDRILVLSDTHFGESNALLGIENGSRARSEARVDSLITWLSGLGGFKEVILLGDIWELWTASFDEARSDSSYFLDRLADLDAGRVIFLPGNHDHHLLVQHQLVEQILAMRDDRDLEVPAQTQRRYDDSHLARLLPLTLRERFTVTYPDHFASVGDRQVVFHHGHHTAILRGGPSIFSSAPLFILRHMEKIGLHELTRSDLELGGTILFELMYAVSHGPRTRARMNDYWERFLTVKHYLAVLSALILRPVQRYASTTERGTRAQEVASYRHAIGRILTLAEEEHGECLSCSAYVFGHTHRAGIVSTMTEQGEHRILANAGTWLHEPAKRNRASEGTFLVIDPDRLVLYRQEKDLSVRRLQQEAWLNRGKQQRSRATGERTLEE